MAQHSPITSQYLFNGLLINPAYAGSRDALATTLSYRHQWAGFEGAPKTTIATLHAPINKKKIALGMTVFDDQIGVTRETGVFSNYAYRIPVGSRAKLSLGLGFGMSFLQANWDQLQLQDDNDIEFLASDRTRARPNFSAGIYYYEREKLFVGLSVPFLLAHAYNDDLDTWAIDNDTKNYEPMLSAGYLYEINREFKLKPSLLVRYDRNSLMQMDISTNLIIKDKVWAGISYRTNDAIIAMLEMLATDQFRIGYSYDMSISDIAPYERGTHELMLQYEFGYRILTHNPRYF
jgi:type IX secretion system PorP/SprF family membrane protein